VVTRFFGSHGAKHWQKVAQFLLIICIPMVACDLESSMQGATGSQILWCQWLSKVAQLVFYCPIWQP